MASFNPFDVFETSLQSPPQQAPPQQAPPKLQPPKLQPPKLQPPKLQPPKLQALTTSDDDIFSIFKSPKSSNKRNIHNQSFSSLRVSTNDGGDDDDDDWSEFDDKWTSQNSRSNSIKKIGSTLSPKVFAAAKRASERRSGGLASSPSRSPSRKVNNSTNPFSPVTRTAISTFQKKGTPVSSAAESQDSKVDASKNNKIYAILDKIQKYAKHQNKTGQQSLALAFAELSTFVSNPQYRNCDQAIDGLLGKFMKEKIKEKNDFH